MSRLVAWSVVMTIAGGALSFSPAQEEEVVVRSLTMSEPGIDDLAHVLDIEKVSGDFDLRGDIKNLRIVMEIHNKGKKVGEAIRGVQLSSATAGNRKGKFSIQIVDLDYLKLGEAPKGHQRVFFALHIAGNTAFAHTDLPKTTFNFGETKGGGSSLVRHADKGRIPLFYKVAGPAPVFRPGKPADVPKDNDENNVLTAYLEVE